MAYDLTPVERRRLKSSRRIEEAPAERIAYQHTVLCQTVLPYRDPGDGVRVWKREQGATCLLVQAGYIRDPATRSMIETGLPYGSRPRLILAHLNREALLHGSPRIEVEHSLSAFIRRIQDRPPTGPEIRRFKDQLSRLAAALVRLAIDLSEERAFQVDTKIIDAFELWLEKDERQRVLWPSVVELSPRYFDSLARHAVPLDERAIGALANSPLPWICTAGLPSGFTASRKANPRGSAGRLSMSSLGMASAGNGISAAISSRSSPLCTPSTALRGSRLMREASSSGPASRRSQGDLDRFLNC